MLLKTFPQSKLEAQVTSLLNYTKYLRRNYSNSTQTPLKNERAVSTYHELYFETRTTVIGKSLQDITGKENHSQCSP